MPGVIQQRNEYYSTDDVVAAYGSPAHGASYRRERRRRRGAAQFVPAMCFALAGIGCKNRDAALRYIDLCGDNRECWYTHLGVDPLVKELDLDTANLYNQITSRDA